MEQQRLLAWSETSGLMDFDSIGPSKVLLNVFGLHRTVILDLLVQIRVLFDEFRHQQGRYIELDTNSPQSSAPLSTATSSNPKYSTGDEDGGNLVPVSSKRKKFITKAMHTLDSVGKAPRHLRWAIWDKENFEALLQKFASLNDTITSYLDSKLQSEIFRTTQETNRGVLQLHRQVGDLQQLVLAVSISLVKHDQLHTVTFASQQSQAKDDEMDMKMLGELAQFKAFNETVEAGSVPDTRIEESSIRFGADHDDESARCEGTYTTKDGQIKNVWIEWKDYDWQDMSRPQSLLVERVQKLAALLHRSPKPSAFRVPHCLGYFGNLPPAHADDSGAPRGCELNENEEPRVGFVFEKPLDAESTEQPVSLRELFKSQEKPRITDRVALAHAIASCVLYLHSVNWLHKALRSHNIVFFRANGRVDYRKPYLSGFDFARPACSQEYTELPGDDNEHEIYRHPLTQHGRLGPRNPYRKSFDIYSLGIMLVELAHWQPINEVLGIDFSTTACRGLVLGVRASLLTRSRLQELGANMGTVFETACRKCIAGDEELGILNGQDETKDNTVAARLSETFYQDVVKKLGSIHV